MKYLYICILVYICTTKCAYAQPTAFRWREEIDDKYIGINLSASRYCGDLSDRYNLAHLQVGWSAELQARYRIKEQWCIMSDIGLYHVWADQRYSQYPANYLTFSTTNFSAITGLQWDIRSIDYNQRNIMYVFAGAGVTRLSPVTTLNGFTYSLSTFRTEGKDYPLWVGQLTYGIGLPITLNPSTQLRIEGRYTHVLSDYLDDVSTSYVDKSTASDVEKMLADKRIAENLPANPIGATRGNARKNDGYFLFTLQFVHKFH